MPVVRSDEYKARMSIAAKKREALRRLKRLGVAEPSPTDLEAPSTNSTNHQAQASSTPAMPLTADSDPSLTPPVSSIDPKRLRELASAGNDLWACASALCATPEAIQHLISPTTWEDYAQDALRAGQAHIKVGLHRRATSGDPRAVELLREPESTGGENCPKHGDCPKCPRCARIAAMTDEELRAERARLLAVVESPRGMDRWKGRLPATCHVEEPNTPKPVVALELADAERPDTLLAEKKPVIAYLQAGVPL